jgi:hypothetical protein
LARLTGGGSLEALPALCAANAGVLAEVVQELPFVVLFTLAVHLDTQGLFLTGYASNSRPDHLALLLALGALETAGAGTREQILNHLGGGVGPLRAGRCSRHTRGHAGRRLIRTHLSAGLVWNRLTLLRETGRHSRSRHRLRAYRATGIPRPHCSAPDRRAVSGSNTAGTGRGPGLARHLLPGQVALHLPALQVLDEWQRDRLLPVGPELSALRRPGQVALLISLGSSGRIGWLRSRRNVLARILLLASRLDVPLLLIRHTRLLLGVLAGLLRRVLTGLLRRVLTGLLRRVLTGLLRRVLTGGLLQALTGLLRVLAGLLRIVAGLLRVFPGLLRVFPGLLQDSGAARLRRLRAVILLRVTRFGGNKAVGALSRGWRLIAGAAAHGNIHSGILARTGGEAGPDGRAFRNEGVCVKGLFLVRLRRVDERIVELPGGADMDQAPLAFFGHRIFEPPPQEADIIRFDQVLDFGGIPLVFAEVELNAAFVLFAAVNEYLLFSALVLEGNARQFGVEHDSDRSGHSEYQKKGVAPLSAGAPLCPADHPICSTMRSVWRLLSWVSSISTELMPMRMTL